MVEGQKLFIRYREAANELKIGHTTLVRAVNSISVYPPLLEEGGLLAKVELSRLGSIVDTHKYLIDQNTADSK